MVRGLLGLVFFTLFIHTPIVVKSQLDFEVVYLTYSGSDEGIIKEFFNQLRENLEQNNLRLVTIQVEPNQEDLRRDTRIHFSPASEELYFDRVSQPVITQISPILSEPQEFRTSLFPLEFSVNMTTGVILYGADRCYVAETYWQEARKYSNSKWDDYLIPSFQANCALIQEDYETAVSIYENYPHIYMLDLSGYEIINLAWAYLQLPNIEKSLEVTTNLVELLKKEYETRSENNGENRKLQTGYSDVLKRCAQLYALAFHYDDAVATMDSAIELDADNPELYVLHGQMILLIYEWDRVLADYNRAIELDPDYADAYYYRGILFYTQGPRENAIADFQRYLELAPDGEHAADAAQYIQDIRRELEVLSN